MNNIEILNNRFWLAEQGTQSGSVLVLGLIVCFLIGVINDWVKTIKIRNKGEMSMKTKMKLAFYRCSKSVLCTSWTMGTNLLTGIALRATAYYNRFVYIVHYIRGVDNEDYLFDRKRI